MDHQPFFHRIHQYTASLRAVLLDLLFPTRCIGCNTLGMALCAHCRQQLSIESLQRCPICQTAVTLAGEVCYSCRSHPVPLDQLIVCSDYHHPLIHRMIHRFKYQSAVSLAHPLSAIMVRALTSHAVTIPDVLIPVPLHPHRKRWRGYNQSELMCRSISQQLTPGLPISVMESVVQRKKRTYSQMTLQHADDRWKNVQDAFSLKETEASILKHKRILLIDDVCTTGATLFSVANVLRQANPKQISAIVIARQHAI